MRDLTVSSALAQDDGVPSVASDPGDSGERVVAAATALLAERGPSGFSLREAARRAGVSHAAPGYLFGDANGLLTEIALRANRRLTASMHQTRARKRSDPVGALRAVGRAYIRFALENTAEFRLLFSDLLDADDLKVAAARLEGAGPLIEALHALHPDVATESDEFAGRMLLAWATVHGAASLAIDGRLPGGDAARRRATEHILDQLVVALSHPLPSSTHDSGAP
jgi:AcrR family transcriptional regulator